MKDLNYYKNNCEEDYIKTPISVLRYITELEKKNEAEQLTLTDVSQRSKLYFAFMQEYNALMGKSEHQILKEEVIVLLAKYSS